MSHREIDYENGEWLRVVFNSGIFISGTGLSDSATTVLGTWLRMIFVRRCGISWDMSVSEGIGYTTVF
jgi:hypothetical protein